MKSCFLRWKVFSIFWLSRNKTKDETITKCYFIWIQLKKSEVTSSEHRKWRLDNPKDTNLTEIWISFEQFQNWYKNLIFHQKIFFSNCSFGHVYCSLNFCAEFLSLKKISFFKEYLWTHWMQFKLNSQKKLSQLTKLFRSKSRINATNPFSSKKNLLHT